MLRTPTPAPDSLVPLHGEGEDKAKSKTLKKQREGRIWAGREAERPPGLERQKGCEGGGRRDVLGSSKIGKNLRLKVSSSHERRVSNKTQKKYKSHLYCVILNCILCKSWPAARFIFNSAIKNGVW